MTDLYWLSVLSNINLILPPLFFMSGLALLIFFLAYLNMSEDEWKPMKPWVRFLTFMLSVCILGIVLIPSDKQLYVIYGIGGTIDYLKENKEAQKLPDNVIKAANAFLESCIKDKQDNENDN